MTENAQLALIGVLGTFLTGLVALIGIYLNLLIAKTNSMQAQAKAAAVSSGKAAETAKDLQGSLDANTTLTTQVRDIVNGERSALLAELAKTKDELKNVIVENAALKAASMKGNS